MVLRKNKSCFRTGLKWPCLSASNFGETGHRLTNFGKKLDPTSLFENNSVFGYYSGSNITSNQGLKLASIHNQWKGKAWIVKCNKRWFNSSFNRAKSVAASRWCTCYWLKGKSWVFWEYRSSLEWLTQVLSALSTSEIEYFCWIWPRI